MYADRPVYSKSLYLPLNLGSLRPYLRPLHWTARMPSPETPTLTTRRLLLRPRRPDDAAALFPDMSDAAFMSWWSRPPFETEDELRARFDVSDGGRRWAITLPKDDTALGFVVATEKPQGRVTEIGFLLARRAQGQGFASEAVAAVLDLLFKEGQRRIFADADPENAASIALLQRLGFQLEGRLRAEWETHMGLRDSLIFGLLKDEWRLPRD